MAGGSKSGSPKQAATPPEPWSAPPPPDRLWRLLKQIAAVCAILAAVLSLAATIGSALAPVFPATWFPPDFAQTVKLSASAFCGCALYVVLKTLFRNLRHKEERKRHVTLRDQLQLVVPATVAVAAVLLLTYGIQRLATAIEKAEELLFGLMSWLMR